MPFKSDFHMHCLTELPLWQSSEDFLIGKSKVSSLLTASTLEALVPVILSLSVCRTIFFQEYLVLEHEVLSVFAAFTIVDNKIFLS